MSDGKKACMACECPCEAHTVHTHGDEGEKCEGCSHVHKDDGTCDCGCA